MNLFLYYFDFILNFITSFSYKFVIILLFFLRDLKVIKQVTILGFYLKLCLTSPLAILFANILYAF